MITTAPPTTKTIRCAIYTRKSHEEGLEQEFNSLHAQREAAELYIASQRHEGWTALPTDYNDGGFTGANTNRPGLQTLMADIDRGAIDCVIVYKVDRLSRSLLDFAKLIAVFDEHDVSFVSVTQQFNTSTSMGRLTLNVLLSFAQFEREIIGERIRDKKAASAKKGKYIGGQPLLGYDVDREKMRLLVNPAEAELVRLIFRQFIETKSSLKVARELNAQGHRTKAWKTLKGGRPTGGKRWNKVYVYRTLTNRKYIGDVVHKGQAYPGEHEAVVDRKAWDKVQRIIADNSHARTMKTRKRTPALLKGILRCGHCGQAMGITFSNNHKKRYRYYLCNHAAKNGYDTCPVKSVAAGEIEGAVMDRIRVILRSPDVIARTFREVQVQAGRERAELAGQKGRLEARLAELRRAIGRLARADSNGDALASELEKLNEEYGEIQNRLEEAGQTMEVMSSGGPTEDDVREALQKLDPLWDVLFPAEKERIVKLLVEEVVVKQDGLLIHLRLNGLNALVAELQAEGPVGSDASGEVGKDSQTVDIRVPMEFRRRSGRKEIILPAGANDDLRPSPQRPIVVALARAHKWRQALDLGKVTSLDHLAQRYDVDRSYVSRVVRLAALAPDIVDRIMTGTEPSGLSLAKLSKPFPLLWSEQRLCLGI